MSWLKLDRRRTVFLDRSLQKRLILSVSVPMFIILGVVLGAQLIFDHLVRQGTLDVHGRILGLPERSLSAVLFFAFATLYQVVHALRFSQRIAGAEYKMKTILQAYRTGDPNARITLRKNDLQHALADEINVTLDWANQEAGQMQGQAAAAPATPSEEPVAARS